MSAGLFGVPTEPGRPKLRPGRHQAQNIYIQRGPEPSDDDDYIGVIFDPERASALIAAVNESLT